MNKYIQICSLNRNRDLYPDVSNFIVNFSQNNTNIYDPILKGTHNFLWQGGQGTTGSTGISEGIIKANSTDNTVYLEQTNANPILNNDNTLLSTESKYYIGYRLNTNGVSRIITDYNPNTGVFTFDTAFNANSIITGNSYIISDPSIGVLTIILGTSPVLPLFHIPYTDAFGNISLKSNNNNIGSYIIDETISFNNTIICTKISEYNQKYNSISQAYEFFPGTINDDNSPYRTDWHSTDIYSVTDTIPDSYKYIIQDANYSLNQITLPSYLTYGTGHFVGKYVYVTGLMGTGANSSTTFDFQTINTNSLNANQSFYITDYSGSPSNILTVKSSSYSIPYYPSTSFPQVNNLSITGLNDIIYITSLLKDSSSNLLYNGSIVSQNEDVPYNVTLISLILPNVILKSGSNIANYSYVYVKLQPLSTPSFLSKNINYSNNPNSTDALFIVPILDVVDPQRALFVKLFCDQTQTIKIKPNESYRFTVFLSNGVLFEPFESDTVSPFPPNKLLQITALFEFTKKN